MGSSFLTALAPSGLYPLTDRLISGLSHHEQVLRLSERGATLVQLREKLLSAREFYAEAVAALDVARRRGVKIIINDRVDIALAIGADGVHLGQDDMPPESARRLLGPQSIIGISTHNLIQAQLALQMPLDYIAIGPVFSTATKESSNPPLGLEGVRAVRQVVRDVPLIAIGGINSDNIEDVFKAGVDAVALISDIWKSTGKLVGNPQP